ncbi:MAG: ribosome maturation factor RimP [Actinomycetota bacterium]|nr:ribosome maturation factor RimP [Actinomycetota bacterium]
MNVTALAQRVESLLTPEALRRGFEVVAVEVAGGHHQPLVRVYVDREGGIDIDAICEANKWISDVLDEDEHITSTYTLEVSSPGIERPLTKPEHFDRFVGENASIKTSPIDGRSHFAGTLLGREDNDLLVDVEGTTFRIPLESVQKARLKPEVDFG